MDPIEDTTQEDFESFHQNFPVVYCCFMILQTLKPESLLIERVALEDPHDVPDFSNRDLWLQRTAFLFCLERLGVNFIQDHYEKIRLELIYYALLRKSLSAKELEILKDLLENKEHFIIAVNAESVLQLLQYSQKVSA